MNKAGVIGWPVSHSLSPKIHGYWLKKLGIDASYEAIPVQPDELSAFVQKQKAANDMRGFNVTIPHKEHIIPLLDDVSGDAKAIGAVNTVVLKNGKATGHNTDKYGFMANLKHFTKGEALSSAFVLGAGGAARAVCKGLLEEGCRVTLANRTEERAHTLAKEFNITVVPWERCKDAMESVSLLVNTTSLGMKGQPALEIPLETLPKEAWVYDIVYAPQQKPKTMHSPVITPLLETAHMRGNCIVDGLGMLLYQAQAAFEMWFGVLPPVDDALHQYICEGL